MFALFLTTFERLLLLLFAGMGMKAGCGAIPSLVFPCLRAVKRSGNRLISRNSTVCVFESASILYILFERGEEISKEHRLVLSDVLDRYGETGVEVMSFMKYLYTISYE